jgi:SAM-dependent methyltransferase
VQNSPISRQSAMPTDNSDQIAEWNGALGQRWAQGRADIDGIVVPFGDAALRTAAPQRAEHVIDVGCGCGDTSIELGRRVGPQGSVLGVDVSRPMLEVARARAGQGAPRLSFMEADASVAQLPSATDLLYSRFGVMFFAAPVPALRHLRAALRARGRFVFACWRTPRDNPWAMAPLVAARKALGITPPPWDPHSPGPFAFADDARLRDLLAQAGFENVDMQRFDAPVFLGATPREAAENAARLGPTSMLVRELGLERLPAIVDGVEAALRELAAPDGHVSLNGSAWIVSAVNP